ncbi:site-specific DNA-methyltransferase [Erythrobacter neustonensis]|uniref:site-specific DNA-methyltransferase n=1 Tax=Erythrobacter neustonensis TaxID=1112 RepID=UPI0018D3AF85|nr:site-specific DNA-methyltransferase [Erythrobacter neustonensis]
MNDTTSDGERAIPKITRDDEAAGSGDLVRENVERLKALFPQIVTDGKVDFDVLRQLLGDEVEEGEERYGLNWKGKRRARAFAMTPSLGTLRPAPEDSVDWDTTQNLMIEGDNLEVLKLLRRSYAGKVKLIYIDPPYNTGNDFVYSDSYKRPLQNYLEKTGQVAIEGGVATSNADSSGRYHTDWLNMMFTRLLIAKELLRNDGVIFINIGDEEVSNLTSIGKEIFGEENFLATIAWQKKYGVSADSKGIPLMQDYIIALQKSDQFCPGLLPRSEKQEALYNNPDNDPRGPWTSGDLLRNEYRERDQFEIIGPTGKSHRPPIGTSWRHPQEQIERMISENRIWFGSDGKGVPRVKRFLSETKQGVVISGWWPHTETGHNDEAKKEVKRLLESDVFQTPKPIRLLKRIFQTADV